MLVCAVCALFRCRIAISFVDGERGNRRYSRTEFIRIILLADPAIPERFIMSIDASSFFESEGDVSVRYAQTVLEQEMHDDHASTPPDLVDASFDSVEIVLSEGTAAIPPDADASAPAPSSVTVLGIYRRGSLPVEAIGVPFKNLRPHQVMVRERIDTRPLLDCEDDDDGCDGDVDEEGEGGRRIRPGGTGVGKERSSDAWLRRLRNRRRRSRQSDDATPGDDEAGTDRFERAVLRPGEGLVMDKAEENYRPFYHEDLSDHDSSDSERVSASSRLRPLGADSTHLRRTPISSSRPPSQVFEERAVLWQSAENYESLMGSPKMSKYFLPPRIGEAEDDDTVEVDDATRADAIERILDSPRFGEQILVRGLAASDIAIGDVFEVDGGHSPLKVEVTSPRLPCSYVDKRNGSPFGLRGLKRHTMTEGLAGWFTRVLVAGELREGMRCVRTAHPHPKWTLSELSRALYGEGPRKKMMKGYPHWIRSQEELEELRDLAALGRKEWRDEVQWILDGEPDSSGDEAETEAKAEEKAGSNKDSFMWIGGSVAACAIAASFCGPRLSDIIESCAP